MMMLLLLLLLLLLLMLMVMMMMRIIIIKMLMMMKRIIMNDDEHSCADQETNIDAISWKERRFDGYKTSVSVMQDCASLSEQQQQQQQPPEPQPWPLLNIDSSISADVPRVVLLTTGSFNPVHSGHVNAMQRARDYLTSLGFYIVGGYISPTHDDYVKPKMQRQVSYHSVYPCIHNDTAAGWR
jgi:hypothetical protein